VHLSRLFCEEVILPHSVKRILFHLGGLIALSLKYRTKACAMPIRGSFVIFQPLFFNNHACLLSSLSSTRDTQ